MGEKKDVLLTINEIVNSNDSIKETLNLLRKESFETFSHSLNVAYLVGCYVHDNVDEFSDVEAIDLITSALLHDVGKLDLPKGLLEKTTPLTDKEFKTIQKHSAYSTRIAKKMGYSKDITNLIEFHHYRANEKSYPVMLPNLKGDATFMKNLAVLSMSDIFSAIVQKRAYKPNRDKDYALNELKKEYFDVSTFVKFEKMIGGIEEDYFLDHADSILT